MQHTLWYTKWLLLILKDSIVLLLSALQKMWHLERDFSPATFQSTIPKYYMEPKEWKAL